MATEKRPPGKDIAPYRAVLDAASTAPMLDQVLTWCAINSGSHNIDGLKSMTDVLAQAFAPLPGDMRIVPSAPYKSVSSDGSVTETVCGDSLLLTVRPDAPMQILLTGHMDTVYPRDDSFQDCRWLDDDILNGPGVADMKGGLAVILAALTAFETWPGCAQLGYQLLINGDEEIASPGSAPLIREAAQGKMAALTYEPAILPDGTLAGARPGSGNFAVVVKGRSAHAGRNPRDGRNAIVAAADLTLRLANLAKDGLTVNPARIDGGSANNVVPDRAVVRFNMRTATIADEATARAGIDAAVAAVAKDHDIVIEVHGGFGRPPKVIDPASSRLLSFVRECGDWLGQQIQWRDTGGVCDGNNIAACGIPVVDTMGVRGGAIHSHDEYLIVPSLAERARLSAWILCRMAEGQLPSAT